MASVASNPSHTAAVASQELPTINQSDHSSRCSQPGPRDLTFKSLSPEGKRFSLARDTHPDSSQPYCDVPDQAIAVNHHIYHAQRVWLSRFQVLWD